MASFDLFGTAAVALGGLIALVNWLVICCTLLSGRFVSGVPLLGGLFLVAGMLALPCTRPYAWAALLLDPGTFLLLIALPRIATEIWSTSRCNLVEEYVGTRGAKMVYLRLFRKGVFTVVQQLQRPAGEAGVYEASTVGEWERSEGRLLLHLGEQTAAFVPVPALEPLTLRQVVGFPTDEVRADLSLAQMDLTLRYKRAG